MALYLLFLDAKKRSLSILFHYRSDKKKPSLNLNEIIQCFVLHLFSDFAVDTSAGYELFFSRNLTWNWVTEKEKALIGLSLKGP